jgi:hypothetical protein
MSRYPKGPLRPRQLHILTSVEEHRRIKVVAAHAETEVSTLFREIFLPEIDRRFQALGGQNGRRKGGRK